MKLMQKKRSRRRAVIENELRWHDEEAHRRDLLDATLYAPPAFKDLVATQFNFLKLEAGERVLEIGSGSGKETLLLSRRGQIVFTFDLSYVQLAQARQQVLSHHADAQVFWIQANAEELPFGDDAFDVVCGKAILHHLDLEIIACEVKRVLRADGRATFAEPMAWHPLIWLGRRLTPQLRTRDEHPLHWRELERFAAHFRQAQLTYFYIAAPLAFVLRFFPGGEGIFRPLWRLLNTFDRCVLTRLRLARALAWYGVVLLRK